MIHKLSFKNFYSFMGEAEVNLAVNKNAPDTDAYFTDSFGNRLTKLMAFVGPNASGKTNLLKCLSFIRWFIRDSFSDLKPEEEILFKPFLFCSEIKPSNFNIEFEIIGKIYKYELEMTTQKILSEKLHVKENKRFKILFERTWGNDKYEFNFRQFSAPANFAQIVRGNASIISTAGQVNHPQSLEIAKYFGSIQTNIIERGKVPVEGFPDTIKYYQENPEIKTKAEEILSKFDLGLSKINIQKIETGDKKVDIPFADLLSPKKVKPCTKG